MKRMIKLAAFALALTCLQAHIAEAQTIPGVGTTYIGLVVGDGRIWVSTKLVNGTCHWQLFNGSIVWGTSSADTIIVVSSPITWCNFNMAAPSQGGQIIVKAGNGNDTLMSMAGAGVHLLGEGGHDTILNFGWQDTVSEGGAGNDKFLGGEDGMYSGGTGDDTFCLNQNEVAVSVRGDSGTDYFCSGSADLVTGIDVWGCECGL